MGSLRYLASILTDEVGETDPQEEKEKKEWGNAVEIISHKSVNDKNSDNTTTTNNKSYSNGAISSLIIRIFL